MSRDVDIAASGDDAADPNAETVVQDQLSDDNHVSQRNVSDDEETEDAAPPAVDNGAPAKDTSNELSDRVNSLVKAILERLVPETQRVADSLAGVEQRTQATESRVSGLGDYARRWTDEILANERQRSAEAFDEIFRYVVYPMHDQLFTKICAMEAGQAEPDPSLLNIIQNLEGGLDRLDVLVIRPQPGEKFDLAHMESMEAVPCRFFRRPDTVARVHCCGFALRHEGDDEETTVIRKSVVDVYRKL